MSFDFWEIMKKIIGVEDLDDFQEVEKKLESMGEGFIFQNNKPTHVIMTLEHYEKLKGKNDISKQEEQTDGLETLLNKIGKKVFVDYYFVFKADNNPEEALENEGFTLASRRSRSSSARSIFRNAMQEAALNNIIASDRMDTYTVDKAKSILSAETAGVVGNTDDDSIEESYHIKIGKMMRGTLTKLIQNGKISEEELLQLQDSEYSKLIMNLNFPVIKVVNAGETIDEAKRDTKGYNRYYDSAVNYKGTQYLICSQWVDNLHKSYTAEWIKEKMLGILVEIVKGLSQGEEFEVRDMLPEYWLYIDHAVRNKIGKAFKPTMIETGLAQLGVKRGNRQIYIRA